MAEIALEHISKRYSDGFEAVKDMNLDVADGEFMILVGPSGCGKSTALRMVAGLEDITAGELKIGGQVVNDKTPKDRDIAMVFQNYALYPHMTVRENMGFALKLAKTPQDEIDKKVNEAARILDLEQHLERKPANLSGGQRQRVAMGRAIVRNPKVFLFDEPLSNLDAKLRVQMRTEIKKVHQTVKTTTVYVTHDQVEAMTLADRVVVMNAGVIEQVGTPQELYHNPATRFVAGFIGSPAMNFMPCQIIDGNGGGLVVAVNEQIMLPVPPARVERYRPYKGKPMVFGMRPEHLFEYHEQGRPGYERVDLKVDVVEPMGMETMVHFFLGGDPICARVAPETECHPEQILPLTADMNNMHLMEADSGKVV